MPACCISQPLPLTPLIPPALPPPQGTVAHVVRVILSISFIVGASTVVYNLKTRFTRENAWQCEMKGDVTSQRRWEAYDKLGTFAIYAVSLILGIQALGLEGETRACTAAPCCCCSALCPPGAAVGRDPSVCTMLCISSSCCRPFTCLQGLLPQP